MVGLHILLAVFLRCRDRLAEIGKLNLLSKREKQLSALLRRRMVIATSHVRRQPLAWVSPAAMGDSKMTAARVIVDRNEENSIEAVGMEAETADDLTGTVDEENVTGVERDEKLGVA